MGCLPFPKWSLDYALVSASKNRLTGGGPTSVEAISFYAALWLIKGYDSKSSFSLFLNN